MKITIIGFYLQLASNQNNQVFFAMLTGWFQAELLQLINKFLDDYEIAYKSAKMTALCKKWQKMVVAQNMLAL